MTEKAPELEGYRLEGELGRGTWGGVYRAVQLDLKRPVAVKMLGQGLVGSAEGRARFVREGRIQGRLSHSNLVPVLDSGFNGETPYLVMELMEGGALRERLVPRRPLEFAEVARIGAALAAGLAHAHRHNVIHRDLKPENVLFSREGEPKIGDFGLAKALDASHALRTADGRIFGTVAYLAPEVIQGEVATPASDTYALGVMLLEMSGVGSLVQGRDASALLQAHLNGTIGSLVRLRGDIPAELRQAMTQCLELDPEMRPASLEAIHARLALVAGATAGESDASLTSNSWTADTPKNQKSRQLQEDSSSAWKTPKKSAQLPAAAPGQATGSRAALRVSGALFVLAAFAGLLQLSRTRDSTPPPPPPAAAHDETKTPPPPRPDAVESQPILESIRSLRSRYESTRRMQQLSIAGFAIRQSGVANFEQVKDTLRQWMRQVRTLAERAQAAKASGVEWLEIERALQTATSAFAELSPAQRATLEGDLRAVLAVAAMDTAAPYRTVLRRLAGPEVERMRDRNPATIRASLTALEETVAALSQSEGDRLLKDWRGLGCLVELLGRRARLRELLGKPVLPLDGQKAPAIRDGYEEMLPFAGPLAELALTQRKESELAEPLAWIYAAAARTLARPTAGPEERERAQQAARLVRPLLRPDELSPAGRADLARNQKTPGP